MSKYQPLWEYVSSLAVLPSKISFDDIRGVLGFPIDHSFLKFKKEAMQYGFTVKKISMKEKSVLFDKI